MPQYRAHESADAWEWRQVQEVAGGLAASGRAALVHPTPERTRGNAEATKDGNMTGREYKRACKLVGLSITKSAEFLDLSKRQVWRIAAGEYKAPLAVEKLLCLMIQRGLQADDVTL
jgi:hypothetical protein